MLPDPLPRGKARQPAYSPICVFDHPEHPIFLVEKKIRMMRKAERFCVVCFQACSFMVVSDKFSVVVMKREPTQL